MKSLKLGSVAFAVMLAAVACTPGASTPAPGSPAASQPTSSEPGASEPGASEPGASEPGASQPTGEFGEIVIGPGEPILIGTALSITGDVATLGLDSQWGAEIAGDLINEEGGLLGHEIAWAHEDAGCAAAETGLTAAQSLVTNENLVAVIGTSCSRTAVTAAPVLGQQGLTLISPANTSPTLTDPSHAEFAGDFYLRSAHNDIVQGLAVATYACEQGWTTAATVHDGSTYSDQLRQAFERSFPEECDGEIVSAQATTSDETNFAGILAPIADAAPDMLFLPLFHPAGTLLIQQSRDLEALDDTQLVGTDGMLGSPDVLEQAGEAAEGMIFSGPACAGDEYENDFLPLYYEKSNEPTVVAPFHCHAYDAANMIFAAIEEVAQQDEDGTLRIDRQALRDALRGTEGFEGLTGTLTCDENGDCADPNIAISQVEGDRYVPFWP